MPIAISALNIHFSDPSFISSLRICVVVVELVMVVETFFDRTMRVNLEGRAAVTGVRFNHTCFMIT